MAWNTSPTASPQQSGTPLEPLCHLPALALHRASSPSPSSHPLRVQSRWFAHSVSSCSAS
eukprot:CAMPEP_0181303426 /NCGR_PEP_ID=MMETSP1101-20121128/8549_1 /TAXON_ID=46948 /ORGANISM="Rhodomonas abbreviata, Strain Caron Lab Isolate" /LENGTH=59 /DNA_ID=CAMNT_0023408993 /DNA_START=626 /DNA_END=802 /DNA_ORIENTATION=+